MKSIKLKKILFWMIASWLITAESVAQVMQYAGVTSTVVRSKDVVENLWPVLKIQVQTRGNYEPLHLLQLNLKAMAKSWPARLGNPNVYFTGVKDSFYAARFFGKVENKGGALSVNGEQQLDSGTNYFWIAFTAKEKLNSFSVPAITFVSCTTGLQEYQQVWADEFDKDGKPDTANWRFEHGFVRNEEDQWYQEENAVCKGGILTIEARRDSILNPRYQEGSQEWRKNRKYIRYTASSINTSGKHAWTYGRWEMRARLDTNWGCWPAWWALGTEGGSWPNNGEIDMMEFYRGKVLANYAVGTQRQYNAKWYSVAIPLGNLNKEKWTDSFHHWRMDLDSVGIAIYLDDVLLNYQPQSVLYNRNGNNDYFPFRHPQYMLLNFALGGQNGGDPSKTTFPRKYEIDYVRVQQKLAGKFSNRVTHTQ